MHTLLTCLKCNAWPNHIFNARAWNCNMLAVLREATFFEIPFLQAQLPARARHAVLKVRARFLFLSPSIILNTVVFECHTWKQADLFPAPSLHKAKKTRCLNSTCEPLYSHQMKIDVFIIRDALFALLRATKAWHCRFLLVLKSQQL